MAAERQMSLIEGLDPVAAQQPLASRMRPKDLSEFVGQQHLVGEGKILRQMIEILPRCSHHETAPRLESDLFQIFQTAHP